VYFYRRADGKPYWSTIVKKNLMKYRENHETIAEARADRDRVDALIAKGRTVFGYPAGNQTRHPPQNRPRWMDLKEENIVPGADQPMEGQDQDELIDEVDAEDAAEAEDGGIDGALAALISEVRKRVESLGQGLVAKVTVSIEINA
jgi:hypothetical protein